ncbi:MAG TPA: hypothetical protein VNP72_06850 [Longimicrobium sp.]|nr:hypothetical protein [Longimicrobium sp.]
MRSGRWGDARRAGVVVVAVLALGACGDRPARDGAAAAADSAPPDTAVVRVRRDSVKAARAVREHAAGVAERARRQAGVEEDHPPARSPPATGEDAYAGCMKQAEVAEGHVRRTIERTCERMRTSPP